MKKGQRKGPLPRLIFSLSDGGQTGTASSHLFTQCYAPVGSFQTRCMSSSVICFARRFLPVLF